MGQWMTPLQSDWVDDNNDKIILTSPLMYRANDGVLYRAPAQFISDGASIPRLLWTCLGHPFHHPTRRPAVLHDYLYSLHYFDRMTADLIFYESMLANGAKRRKAVSFFVGVRVGGWAAKK
jgi:hypothetical protein